LHRGEGLLLLVLLCLGMALPGHATAPWHLGPFVKADAANPILGPLPTTFTDPMTGQTVAWESDNVFNPAATVRDGRVCLLYRAEDHSGEGVGQHTSRIGLAESADGLHFVRRPAPVLFPADDAAKTYEWTGGCEDPRCVETADGGYVLTYTAWDRKTARLSAATSRDLVHWDKHGPVFAQADGGKFRDQWSKSGAIVTKLVGDHLVATRIDGKYWMLWGEGTVSAATSTDLVNWDPVLDTQGNPVTVLSPRPGRFDSGLCESGPPAVLTAQGIVFLYNGKNADQNGDPTLKAGTYSGGQALLDAHDPTHVLARDDTPFITPQRPYEVTGQYAAGTDFIEGLVHFHKRWWLYYGTADSHVAVASAPDIPPVPARAALPGTPSDTLPAPISLDAGWQLQDTAKITATGEAISRRDYKPAAWHKATVPGTVLTSLVNDGVYPEPLYGENNRPDKIPDSLCRTSYWYRTTFRVPHSDAGRRVQLNFAGINYAAEVWVNGHDLGDIRGAFARGLFDVTPDVIPGDTNVLAVQILPPPHPGVPVEQTLANGVGPNGGILASDGPTFLCSIGWDWIPGIRDRDMGIWQGVTLSAAGPVTIADPYVTSDLPLPRTDTADLTIQTTLHNTTDKPQAGTLNGTFGQTTFRRAVTLAPGETKTLTLTPATTPPLHITHPRLWWPNGYGPQNLYTLHLSFVTGSTVSDAADTTFGIRKITYAVPGSENLTLVVNGVPVVAKGGDWGMDEAMKRIPRARLDAQIRMHKLANYTIIRNWVGQSTSQDFYDLCDKYGILVWDEFFQPNPADGPNPDDTDLYLANVREKVLRFRSHPCIALWCARNEGDPPPAIDKGLQAMLADLDTARLYQRSSTAGRGVHSGGPYFWRAPRDFYSIDAPFKTEIGSVSVPTLASVESMMPRKDWQTINDDWAEHDLARGAQAGDRYPQTLGSRYGHEANLADFVRKAQLANYEAFRAMYEGRLCHLFQPTTGVITWMSNPAQPSFVWQLYAYDLEPNASLFATRKACEPVHVMMNESNGHLIVINNNPQALPDLTAKVTVVNLDGSVRYAHTDTLTAAPSAATDLGAIPFPDGLSPVHFIKLTLTDTQRRLLSDNFYWRADPAHPDDLTALNTLPTVTLTATATRHDANGRCLLSVTLRNPANTVALITHLQLRRATSGRRVLPVFYNDNYVSLLPGEVKTITVDAAQRDLGGEAPSLAVDGWNVTVKPTTTGIRIIPNADALAVGGAVPSTPDTPILSPDLRINCGGGSSIPFTFGTAAVPSDAFSEDADFVGGRVKTVGDAIDTHAQNAAPASVYQSERWGACTYTIPVEAKATYTVRLHFAETTFTQAGARKFNVNLNGKRVLTDFDVFAEAGGAFKAVVKDVSGIAPDAAGHIVIAFSNGSADQPKISGIEVLAQSKS
jgi:predicted GH43/DUF377 family glycosyl hydrolase